MKKQEKKSICLKMINLLGKRDKFVKKKKAGFIKSVKQSSLFVQENEKVLKKWSFVEEKSLWNKGWLLKILRYKVMYFWIFSGKKEKNSMRNDKKVFHELMGKKW